MIWCQNSSTSTGRSRAVLTLNPSMNQLKIKILPFLLSVITHLWGGWMKAGRWIETGRRAREIEGVEERTSGNKWRLRRRQGRENVFLLSFLPPDVFLMCTQHNLSLHSSLLHPASCCWRERSSGNRMKERERESRDALPSESVILLQ